MISDTGPVTILGNNLSEAWAKAFLLSYKAHQGIIAPGIVSFPVDEKNPKWELENLNIRTALDEQLEMLNIRSANQSNIETVAGTIFPESIWKRCIGDRNTLREKYLKMWPQIKKCSANRWDTYFKRLISYGDEDINQLQAIIDAWDRKIRRRSAFQAGIFDPSRDHRQVPFLGFPCLQQVVFHPIGPNGRHGMKVVALYANQLLTEKAYGNYLGLYRLGKFMASQMGLTLKRVTCIATNLKRSDHRNKGDFSNLVTQLRKEISNA